MLLKGRARELNSSVPFLLSVSLCLSVSQSFSVPIFSLALALYGPHNLSLPLAWVCSPYSPPPHAQTLQTPQTSLTTNSSGWARTTAILSLRTGCNWTGHLRVSVPSSKTLESWEQGQNSGLR